MEDEHLLEYLQKVLDYIYIKGLKTNVASCVKTVIDKFKNNNDRIKIVFIYLWMDLMKNFLYPNYGQILYLIIQIIVLPLFFQIQIL